MKQHIKNYILIIVSLLIFAFFASLILAFLETRQILDYKTSLVVANSISYLMLAIFSFILGIKIKKNGILNGLIFSLIMIAITLMFGNSLSEFTTLLKVITKSIIIIFFTILGVNKKNS